MRKSRNFSVILTVVVLFFVVLSYASADRESHASTASDRFPAWENPAFTEYFILSEGAEAQLQINVNSPVRAVSVCPSGEEGDRVFEASLFRWDKNPYESVRGTEIASETITDWKTGTELLFNIEEATGKPLEAGEYFVIFRLVSGEPVVITRFSPPRMGLRSYENYTRVFGAFEGYVYFTEEVLRPFNVTTDLAEMVYNTAPPQAEIPEDSAIVRMSVDSDQWVAIDGLGRTLPTRRETGAKKEKYVGIFYWTWHLEQAGGSAYPNNINNIMLEHPELKGDYYNELWGQYTGTNFWNEPLWGYYTEADDYVLRKHAELLADAGVDFVMFDCTNGTMTWPTAYLNLCKVWSEAREQGIKTPQISFMMQFDYSASTRSSLKQIYNVLYKDENYQDLWFYWEGKPLVMAYNTGLDENVGIEAEIKNYFTFKYPVASYFNVNSDDSHWGWLSVYPQALYKNEDGTVEMTTVGIAQNADYERMALSAMNGEHNMGRSFTMQKDFSYSYRYRGKKIKVDASIENSDYYGLNFQEQWDYAISKDPEIIFVTGWNEWIMGRYDVWGDVPNAFPDQYNDANSRDIEPTKGALKDYYYYQFVANVRRFKGMNERKYQPESKTIDISGSLDQWNDEKIISYNHYTKNTYERDCDGFGCTHYTGEGIRNDIVTAKVSYDSKNLYFYVETLDALTSETGKNWMRLLLDTERATKNSKDWEEFEYILGRVSPKDGKMLLEKSTGGWNWKEVAWVDYRVSGNVLQVVIPRSCVGMKRGSPEFGFKWCDNNLDDGDIMTLYTEGDSAPGGRFQFWFTTEKESMTDPLIIWIISGVCVTAVVICTVFAVRKIVRKKRAA